MRKRKIKNNMNKKFITIGILLIGILLILFSLIWEMRMMFLIITIILCSFSAFMRKEKTRNCYLMCCSIIVTVLIVLFTCVLVLKYFFYNREIIKQCYSEYPGVFSVIENKNDQLALYINEYYIPQEGFYITDVTFTPEDCLYIADEIVVSNHEFTLSFYFPNGAKIAFSNYQNGEFKDVVLDNSNTRGFIIPNLGYYKDYNHFEHYYIYGALNDLPSFEESKIQRNIHANYLDMLIYAVNNATVFTDEHTYQEEYYSTNYLDSDHRFGYLLDFLCINESKDSIHVDNDVREYTDRYALPYVIHDWFSVNDISKNMNIYMEKQFNSGLSVFFNDYVYLRSGKYINIIKEKDYYIVICTLLISETILLFGLFKSRKTGDLIKDK